MSITTEQLINIANSLTIEVRKSGEETKNPTLISAAQVLASLVASLNGGEESTEELSKLVNIHSLQKKQRDSTEQH